MLVEVQSEKAYAEMLMFKVAKIRVKKHGKKKYVILNSLPDLELTEKSLSSFVIPF